MGTRYIEGTATRCVRQVIYGVSWQGVMSHAVSVPHAVKLTGLPLALAPGGDPDDPAGQHRH